MNNDTAFVELVFTTEHDTRRSIRFPNPAGNLTAERIQTAANGIVDANAFDNTVARLTGLSHADIVNVHRILLIPPQM